MSRGKWIGICILLFCVGAVCGVGLYFGVSHGAAESDTKMELKAETEDSEEETKLVETIAFERTVDPDVSEEFAQITAYDKDHNMVWEYGTDGYPLTENECLADIGEDGDHYYFNECGTVVALDRNTGEVLWKNDDFVGVGGDSAIGDDGVLYLCGYQGPDFCAVDPDGTTIKRIESFGEYYAMAHKIRCKDDHVEVSLEAGPDGWSEDGYTFSVSLDDYSVELIDKPDMVLDGIWSTNGQSRSEQYTMEISGEDVAFSGGAEQITCEGTISENGEGYRVDTYHCTMYSNMDGKYHEVDMRLRISLVVLDSQSLSYSIDVVSGQDYMGMYEGYLYR